MLFLRFIFSIFSILITGYIILKLFFHPKERLPFGEIIILAFGIGVGFAGLETLFLSFTKYPLNTGYLLSFQFMLLVIAIFKFKKSFFYWKKSYTDEKVTYSPLALFFLLIILWEIIYIFLEAFSLPFTAWDAWGNWGFKAKIIFSEKTFPLKLWTELPWIKHPAHLDYPLLIPFTEAYIYFFLGQVHDAFAKLFCSFYYLGIISLFYYHLKKRFNINFVLVSCFCLATIPNILMMAPTGYMEMALIFYITGGIFYIWRYLEEKDISFLSLGSIFIGLGMWTKNEGFSLWLTLFLSSLLMCLLFRLNIDKKRLLISVLFIPLLIFSPWIIFKYIFGLKAEFFASSLQNLVKDLPILLRERMPLIFNILIKNCLDFKKWNILWFGFVFTLIWFLIKPYKKLSMFFIFIIILQIIFDFVIYIIWPVNLFELELHIFNSVDRLLVDIAPLALFFICQQLGKRFDKNYMKGSKI